MICGGDVVTMNERREVLVGGSVVVDDDVIVAVGSTVRAPPRIPTPTVLDATGVRRHARHDQCPPAPDRRPAGAQLHPRPAAARRRRSSSGRCRCTAPTHPHDDELAAIVVARSRRSRNGVTTVVEAGTVAHADASSRPARGRHARHARGVGLGHRGRARSPRRPPRCSTGSGRSSSATRAGGLVEGWVTLVGHDLASDELLAGAADLARELRHRHDDAPVADVVGSRALPRAAPAAARWSTSSDLGVLGRHLLLGHGVWLDDDEVELILSSDTAIAYCPWAYLRLGQGVFANGRHAEIVERGGRGRARVRRGQRRRRHRHPAHRRGGRRASPATPGIDPTRFGAHQVFELATIAGAEAIGLADRIGSIEVGKQADLVVHRTDTPGWTPRGDVGLQLVWGTDGRSVRDVFVAGRHVVADGKVVSIDVAALAAAAADHQRHLLERAGITVPRPWPHIDAR